MGKRISKKVVKTKKYKYYVSTNKVGSEMEEVVEVDEDASPEEIEEGFKTWVWEKIDSYYEEIEE